MALQDGAPIGFYALIQAARPGVIDLDHLWVHPVAIGQGIGRRLFLHAFDRVRSRAARELRIEAEPHAVGFYEHMGARQVGEVRTRIDGQSRVLPIMILRL